MLDKSETERKADALEVLAEMIAEAIDRRNAAKAPPRRPSPLVGGKQLAAELGSSEDTVARLASSGAIPCVHVGGRRRYDVAAVREALAHRDVKPAKVAPVEHGVVRLSRGGSR